MHCKSEPWSHGVLLLSKAWFMEHRRALGESQLPRSEATIAVLRCAELACRVLSFLLAVVIIRPIAVLQLLPPMLQQTRCTLLLLDLLLVADCGQQLAVMRECHSHDLKVMLLQHAASGQETHTYRPTVSTRACSNP
jgi:hypothetical protein